MDLLLWIELCLKNKGQKNPDILGKSRNIGKSKENATSNPQELVSEAQFNRTESTRSDGTPAAAHRQMQNYGAAGLFGGNCWLNVISYLTCHEHESTFKTCLK
jgi:hypothetical protein